MNGPVEAAYAVLGLRPGADRATVEHAYRRLIKQHHPDHTGGSGERASEINRAYTLIRNAPAFPPPMAVIPPPPRRARRRRGSSPILVLGLLVLVIIVAHTASGGGDWPWATSQGSFDLRSADDILTVAPTRPGLEEPLATRLIDLAVADAVRLHAQAEPPSMAASSSECLRALRANPSASRFDSCAAFDEAISILEGGRAGFQQGPFNASAVSARQVAAGRLLSNDTFAVDSRLQQVRARVQLALFPRIPDPPKADINAF